MVAGHFGKSRNLQICNVNDKLENRSFLLAMAGMLILEICGSIFK